MTKGFIRLVRPTMKNCFPANKVQNYFIKSAHLLDLHILHCVVLNKTYEMICCKQNRPARDIQLMPKIVIPLELKKYIEFIFILIKISSEALI